MEPEGEDVRSWRSYNRVGRDGGDETEETRRRSKEADKGRVSERRAREIEEQRQTCGSVILEGDYIWRDRVNWIEATRGTLGITGSDG